MLKIRMQGTKKDLHWFRRILEGCKICIGTVCKQRDK